MTDSMRPEYTDDEMRSLLTRLLTMIRETSAEDPDLVAAVERTIVARRQRMVGLPGLEPGTSSV